MPHRPLTHRVIPTSNFAESFFAPARIHLGQAPSARICPELSDDQWLLPGVRRVLEDRPTGRGFLQHLLAAGLEAPATSPFFATLQSARRLALIAEVSHGLARSLPALGADFWGGVPELEGFEIQAGDGHFHAAAAHDTAAADDGVKYATGHFFTLDLRTHALAHLTAADQVERKKEPFGRLRALSLSKRHDMHALKRLSMDALRQGAAKGRKVLYVWDRAGIDFRQWHHWKHSGGLYFLSREPSGAR